MAAKSGHARMQSTYQISKVRARQSDSRAGASPSKSMIGPPLETIPTAIQKIKDEYNQVDGWLEAMRASSPRYNCCQLDESNEQVYFDKVANTRYQEWVVSAFL